MSGRPRWIVLEAARDCVWVAAAVGTKGMGSARGVGRAGGGDEGEGEKAWPGMHTHTRACGSGDVALAVFKGKGRKG